MLKTAVLAALCAVLFASNAEARQRHRHHVAQCVETGTVLMPVCGMGHAQFQEIAPSEYRSRNHVNDLAARAESRRLARGQELYDAMPFGMPTRSASEGRRFIRGHLKCAVNVGAELARRGIRGTGSALAKSYLHWGRASGPVAGAVAIFNRGGRGKGHVAIVHHVESDGTVIYLNPSARRQAWQIGPYRKRPIAYRVAGF